MTDKLKTGIRKISNSIQDEKLLLLNNIYEYIQSEMEMRSGDIKHSDKYIFYRMFHRLTKICSLSDGAYLKRVGKNNDGGYVMAVASGGAFSSGRIAYSIGINKDVSWDMDMANAGYEVYQYDHTINKLPIENKKFHWKKIGLTGGTESHEMKRIGTLITENGHDKDQGMVLKCDIEGYEWEVFDNISDEDLCRFDQIVLEMHACNDMNHKNDKIRVLKKLNKYFDVIHIHGNNVVPVSYCGELNLPSCIEITYVKRGGFKTVEDGEHFLPIPLDQPCADRYPEMRLGNWNV